MPPKRAKKKGDDDIVSMFEELSVTSDKISPQSLKPTSTHVQSTPNNRAQPQTRTDVKQGDWAHSAIHIMATAHGRGLYASETIPAGTLLLISHSAGMVQVDPEDGLNSASGNIALACSTLATLVASGKTVVPVPNANHTSISTSSSTSSRSMNKSMSSRLPTTSSISSSASASSSSSSQTGSLTALSSYLPILVDDLFPLPSDVLALKLTNPLLKGSNGNQLKITLPPGMNPQVQRQVLQTISTPEGQLILQRLTHIASYNSIYVDPKTLTDIEAITVAHTSTSKSSPTSSSLSTVSQESSQPPLPPCLSLFPTMALLNHSCAPNVVPRFHADYHPWTSSQCSSTSSSSTTSSSSSSSTASNRGAGPLEAVVSVRALRDIHAGEELVFNYLPLISTDGASSLPWLTDHRREGLRRHYGFTCDCPRCTLTPSLLRDALYPLLPGTSPSPGPSSASTPLSLSIVCDFLSSAVRQSTTLPAALPHQVGIQLPTSTISPLPFTSSIVNSTLYPLFASPYTSLILSPLTSNDEYKGTALSTSTSLLPPVHLRDTDEIRLTIERAIKQVFAQSTLNASDLETLPTSPPASLSMAPLIIYLPHVDKANQPTDRPTYHITTLPHESVTNSTPLVSSTPLVIVIRDSLSTPIAHAPSVVPLPTRLSTKPTQSATLERSVDSSNVSTESKSTPPLTISELLLPKCPPLVVALQSFGKARSILVNLPDDEDVIGLADDAKQKHTKEIMRATHVAIELMKSVQGIVEQAVGSLHWIHFLIHSALGVAYTRASLPELALPSRLACYAIAAMTLPPRHPSLAQLLEAVVASAEDTITHLKASKVTTELETKEVTTAIQFITSIRDSAEAQRQRSITGLP